MCTWLVGRLTGWVFGPSVGFGAARVLAAVTSGLPLVMFASALLVGDSDDGRGAGMLAVAALGFFPISFSCWGAVWLMRPQSPEPGGPAELGFTREVPREANS